MKIQLSLLWCVSLATLAAAPVLRVDLSVARADVLLARLPAGDPWEKTPDGSTLAWGESHLLHALVDLYEATGEAKYLAEVARRGDRLLGHRDDRRGVKDGSGHSRPAWSMASKYVVATGTLRDTAGRPALELRSLPSAYNNSTRVTVTSAGPDRVSLRIVNEHFKREEWFETLSLEPGAARFVGRIMDNPVPSHVAKAGRFTERSGLIRVTIPAGARVPAPQSLTLEPVPLAYTGYLGVIYHPLLRLAEIVKADPRLAAMVPAADRFVRAAEESYADASARLWREGPRAGEGYYLCCERGESFPFDNIPEPFNYLGRHASAQFALHRLTGRAEYRERATKLARLFHHRLKLDAARDLYTWNYWYEPVTTTGWTPANSPSFNLTNYPAVAAVEDTSHGILDVALLVNAHAAGVVVERRDLERVANTLLRHVLNPERTSIRRRVDGQGGDHPPFLPALAGWLELANVNPAVYREIRRTVENAAFEDLRVTAALLKWERRLGNP